MNGPDRQSGVAVPDGETLFRSLFGQVAVGIAVGSLDGRFLRVNEALCRLLGYGEQELLQKSFEDITHDDDRQASRDFQNELLTTSQSRVYEKRYLSKDGSTVWVRITGTLVRDRSGAPQCSVALIHDITEVKLAEDWNRAIGFWQCFHEIATEVDQCADPAGFIAGYLRRQPRGRQSW